MIPDYLGGEATKITKPKIFNNVHNRKMSRWFRKIASLHHALLQYQNQYDIIIWIDCDCYFINHLSNDKIIKIMNNYDAFYHMGDKRLKLDLNFESGLIGFRKPNGYKLLNKVFDCYTSKQYQNYKRWDDGYIFRMIFQENTSISQIDLATKSKTTEVIPIGPFNKYIIHNKGSHKRKNILI